MHAQIRKLIPKDWAHVKSIYQQGLDTGIASFETQAPSWRIWDKKYLEICRLVAVENNEIMGWIALSPVSAREVYKGVGEVSIYIDLNHVGKGVGKLLMQALIEESEQAGIWTLQAGIFRENTPSLRLHEKMGFRQIGYREKIAQRGGLWFDNILMERRSKRVGT